MPDDRRNVLSLSYMRKAQWPIGLLAVDNLAKKSLCTPGLHKQKKQGITIPIIPIDSLFAIRTISEGEELRSHRKENKWLI